MSGTQRKAAGTGGDQQNGWRGVPVNAGRGGVDDLVSETSDSEDVSGSEQVSGLLPP